MLENEMCNITYSVVVTYTQHGNILGYIVNAKNRSEAFGKLMQQINLDYVSKIEIAEVVVDMIKQEDYINEWNCYY